MIVVREWDKWKKKTIYKYHYIYKGWFLFGIVPILIIRYTDARH